MHSVTATYGDNAISEDIAECWTVVITMVILIWNELIKLKVEVETAHVSDTSTLMMGQYLWGTLQAHRVVGYFLLTQC